MHDAYGAFDVVETTGSRPQRWSVNVPIYTSEEDRSDLTLQVTVIQTPGAMYKVEVDDLNVL